MMSLHEELKAIRLEKNISLEDIYHQLKIRVEILEKVEAGDYSVVPTPYLRAFLREYAEVVGIDQNHVIEVFDKKRPSIRIAQSEETAVLENVPLESLEILSVPDPFENEKKAETDISEKAHEDPIEDIIIENVSSEEEASETIEDWITAEVSDEDMTEDNTAALPENSLKTEMLPEEVAPEKTEEIQPPEPSLPEKNDESETGDISNRSGKSLPKNGITTPMTDGSKGEKATKQKPFINDNQLATIEERPAVRRRLDIDDPDSGGRFFFIMFLMMLIIAAAVIVWMNRSGMF